MVLGNDQGKFVGTKTFVAQIRGVPGDKAKADVHSTFFQGGFNVRGRDFLDGHTDGGMVGGKQPEQIRHQRYIEHWNNAQVQRTAQLPGLGVQFVEKIFKLSQQRPSMLLENQASRSKQNAFASTLKE